MRKNIEFKVIFQQSCLTFLLIIQRQTMEINSTQAAAQINSQTLSTVSINQQISQSEKPKCFKIDRLFYTSVGKARQQYALKIKLYIFLICSISFYLFMRTNVLGNFNLNHKTQGDYLKYFLFYFVVAFYNLIISVLILEEGYADKNTNNQVFLQLAGKMNHIVQNQPIFSEDLLNNLEQCTSKQILNANSCITTKYVDLEEYYKNEGYSISIRVQIKVLNHLRKLLVLHYIGKIASFVVVILGVFTIMLGKLCFQWLLFQIAVILIQSLNILITAYILMRLCVKKVTKIFDKNSNQKIRDQGQSTGKIQVSGN